MFVHLKSLVKSGFEVLTEPFFFEKITIGAAQWLYSTFFRTPSFTSLSSSLFAAVSNTYGIFLFLQNVGRTPALNTVLGLLSFFFFKWPNSSLKTIGNCFYSWLTNNDSAFDGFSSILQQMASKALVIGGSCSIHSMPSSWFVFLVTKQRPRPWKPAHVKFTSNSPNTSISVPFAAPIVVTGFDNSGEPILTHVWGSISVTSAPESSCIRTSTSPNLTVVYFRLEFIDYEIFIFYNYT